MPTPVETNKQVYHGVVHFAADQSIEIEQAGVNLADAAKSLKQMSFDAAYEDGDGFRYRNVDAAAKVLENAKTAVTAAKSALKAIATAAALNGDERVDKILLSSFWGRVTAEPKEENYHV